MQIQCPPVSEALLRYLEAVFPDQAANPATDDPMKHFGAVSVVRHLRAVRQSQEEDDDVST